MREMDSSAWQRMGSSIVWSPALLEPLIPKVEPVPLRVAVGWLQTGFPSDPPGDSQTVLVGGLQTVLETLESVSERYNWLRQNVLPLVRAVQSQWDRVGLVFVMDGPGRLFQLNEADELVYFGRSRVRDENVKITLGIWNGAASGDGAYQLVVTGSKEVGGYHVRRVS